MPVAGRDYIGVGVGAMVFNEDGRVFLSRRGPEARNERDCWEFPGGGVAFGEKLSDAIVREFYEEYAMHIEVIKLLGVPDHIIHNEQQHWVSPTFIARHIAGTPRIVEIDKCTGIGWFSLMRLPEPLSIVSQYDVEAYLAEYGTRSDWYDWEHDHISRPISDTS